MTNRKSVVYIVEDDPHVRDALTAMMEAHDLSVEAFENGEDFYWGHAGDPAGCLVVDYNLPGENGVALIQRIRADGSQVPAILMSGRINEEMRVAAEKAGAVRVIAKPLDPTTLLDLLSAAGIALPSPR